VCHLSLSSPVVGSVGMLLGSAGMSLQLVWDVHCTIILYFKHV
jgi:hypothetical protein